MVFQIQKKYFNPPENFGGQQRPKEEWGWYW